MYFKKGLPGFVVLLFLSLQLFGQPANDDCTTATMISVGQLDSGGSCTTISSDNTDATPWEISPGVFFTGNCWGGTIDSVVFYQFNAQGVSVEITVNGPATPKIALITAPGCDPSAGIEFGCNVGNTISIDNGLTVGTSYYVVVGFEGQAEGPYDICVYNPTNQPNDECDFAVPILNLDDNACEFNLDNYYPSTSSNFFPGCWGGTLAEVWFSFTAQGVSIADLHVENGPANAYIAVLDGSCSDIGNMLVLGCGANGNPIVTDNNLVVGNTYYVVVAFDNYAGGTFDLCLDNPVNAFNDDCFNAPVIPPLQLSNEDNCLTVIDGNSITNDYPSTDLNTFACWNNGDSYNVWYQFVAQGPDVDVEVDPLSFTAAEQIALVYFENNNTCDGTATTIIECSNGDPLTLDNTLIIGNTYYVVVGFEDNAYGDYCINVFNPMPPPNDTACAAIPLNTTGGCNSPQVPCPGGGDCFTTEYANPDYPNNVFPPECAPGMQNNVFYTISLDDPENVGFELTLTEGTASNLNMMLLQFNDCTQQFDILFTYCETDLSMGVEYGPVEPGEVYYLIVGTAEEDEGTFEICVDEIPPCFENNYCEDLTGGMSNAEDIGLITTFDPAQDCTAGGSDEFTCVEGCNLFADPEPGLTPCLGDDNPVVWYQFTTDFQAGLLNMTITSDDFAAPSVQLWSTTDGTCNTLTLEGLTGENFACMVGSQGQLVANSTPVNVNTTYFLAISGINTFGGDFELCLATVTQQAACVTASSLDVIARSFGGPIEGPYFPGEVVSVCLNVDNFQVSGANNCQWFQGIVPVFGAGWDPSSFDGDGQPLNATMNGSSFPAPNNHNSGTFDWWTSVSYHHPHCYYNVGDFDGNGTLDMCNSQYDPDCTGPGLAGSSGNGACWYDQDPGTFLPGGWFTAGVNGSCGSSIGYPGVDWGDGNTCNGSTGPWNFCFDLTVRTDCADDPSYSDLTIGFISFADGEVGSWDGSASICGQDEPLFQQLPLCCNELVNVSESKDPICSGGVFSHYIDGSGIDENVDFWEWTVDAGAVVGAQPGSGPNGTQIIDNLVNTGTSTEFVTYNLLGFAGGECPAIILTVDIEVNPEITIDMSPYLMCGTPTTPYLIEPVISGGSGNYEFEWNDPNQTATANLTLDNPVDGTSYTLVVTDETGCESSASITLDVYETFPVDIVPSNTEQCEQSGTINLSVTASGGTGVFSQYDWSTPGGGTGMGQAYEANVSGQYLVEVTDDQGCIGKDSIQLQFFEAPEVDLVVEDPFICPDVITQIFSTVNGGQGPYLYEWEDGTSTSFNAAEIPGTYTLLVTDNNGCTSTASIEVGAADVPDVDLGGTQQICVGDALPELSIEGQGPYIQIIWSTGVIGSESITLQDPGLYSVTVINDEGCQNTAEAEVSFFPQPMLDLPDTLSYCQGQGVFFNAFDPQWVQYDWQHISGDDNTADVFFSNPGVYSLITYDANGCEAEDEIEVIESEFLTPVISGDRTICEGETGIYTIEEFFSMEWTDLEGTILSDSAALWVDTAGTFILNIIDDSGCPGIDTFDVAVSVPSVSITGPATICTDAVASLDAGPGYSSYSWNNGSTAQTILIDTGGTFAVTVTDQFGCAVTDAIDVVETDLVPEITGDTAICSDGIAILDAGANYISYAWSTGMEEDTLPMLGVNTPGIYTVTVTDLLGCEGTDSFEVFGYPDPVVNVTGDMDFCVGGVAMLNAGSGFASYAWSTAVPGDTTQLIAVNAEGTYTVTVTDLNGCTATGQMVVNPPYQETMDISGSLSFCTGSSTTLDAGANYASYAWSTGADSPTIVITSGGTYSVTVIDAGGCIASDTVTVDESDELTPNIQGPVAMCTGTPIELTVGASYASVEWNTSETTPTITVTAGGTYTVTVSDAGGCTGEAAYDVAENTQPSATVTSTALTCNDPADGSTIDFMALITAGETTGDWMDIDGSGADLSDLSNVDFEGITPGIYQFTYTTNSAVAPCVDQQYPVTITVLDCACPNVQVNPAGETCNDGGTIDLESLFQPTTEAGGTWALVGTPSGSQPVSLNGSIVDVTDADAGDYTFKYTAPNINLGCPDTSFTTLTVNAPPNAGVVVESVMLCIGEDSIVNLTQLVSGADPAGTWSETSLASSTGGAFNANTATFRTVNQASALYTFEYFLAGQGSCLDAATTVEVMIEPLPLADAGLADELTCEKQEVTLSGSGSSQGSEFIYAWTTIDGGTIQDAGTLNPKVNAPGTYVLTVQNSLSGCVSEDSVTVLSNEDLPTDIDFFVDAPVCAGEGAASIEIFEVSGGTAPYSYALNGGQPTSDIVIGNLAPGNYELMVEDANGCQYATTFNVPVPNALEVQIDGEIFIEAGDSLQLSYVFTSTNAPQPDSIVWKTEDDPAFCVNCPSISLVPADDIGEIIVEAYDENGCRAIASIIYRVAFERIAYVPNVFTPNDDQINDRFTVYVNEIGATVLNMEIFTRWGEKVYAQQNFEPNVPELGWDGRVGSAANGDPGVGTTEGDMLLPGVYVYYIHLVYQDGIDEVIKGDITLLR